METPLDLSTRLDSDGTPVVTAVGEIDMSNVSRLAKMLSLAAADGTRVVVDLTAVEYLDSAGIKTLFAHASRIRIIASPLLLPALTVSGLSGITTIREASLLACAPRSHDLSRFGGAGRPRTALWRHDYGWGPGGSTGSVRRR